MRRLRGEGIRRQRSAAPLQKHRRDEAGLPFLRSLSGVGDVVASQGGEAVESLESIVGHGYYYDYDCDDPKHWASWFRWLV
ncbi:MAG TPA: hypothetical protein VIH88_09365 [Candidatus Acidoferrales bacterium]